jgi:hypothetical protein
MLGVFAEFERSIIQERIAAGIARARAKGTRSGKSFGRPTCRRSAKRLYGRRWRRERAFAELRGLSAPAMRPWRGSPRRCAKVSNSRAADDGARARFIPTCAGVADSALEGTGFEPSVPDRQDSFRWPQDRRSYGRARPLRPPAALNLTPRRLTRSRSAG